MITKEHIGKQKFRAKEFEEDIKVINEINKEEFLVSIKDIGMAHFSYQQIKNLECFLN